LGKTLSGQPIFPVDEETAQQIKATFIIDLAMLRSYGRDGRNQKPGSGLNRNQKEMLLALALWKVHQLLRRTFSYRSGCKLRMQSVTIRTDDQKDTDPLLAAAMPAIDIQGVIGAAGFPGGGDRVTPVYYPFDELFRPGKDKPEQTVEDSEEAEDEE
jgi:CRISPR-associated protein Csb1